jgi:hypothetical protein
MSCGILADGRGFRNRFGPRPAHNPPARPSPLVPRRQKSPFYGPKSGYELSTEMSSITSVTSAQAPRLDPPSRVTIDRQPATAASTAPATAQPAGPTRLQQGLDAIATTAFRHELAQAPAAGAGTLWDSGFSSRIWTGQGWAQFATGNLLAAARLAAVAAYSPPGTS